MDKLFQPNKWFVIFCGLLIVVFFSLQYVVNTRLSEIGKMLGTQIFTWEWPQADRDCYSNVVITDCHVVKRSETDAVLEVKAKQVIEEKSLDIRAKPKEQQGECDALLTLYRSGKNWELGKVELR